MKRRHEAADTRNAFTLVELLIVICIISLLIALFIPTMLMVKDRLLRLRCASNLNKCHKVMLEYAANNDGWLPPSFVSAKQHTFICDMDKSVTCHMQHTELADPSKAKTPILPLYAELKLYGACADIFTCPAYDGYGDADNVHWKSWTIDPPFSEDPGTGVGKVYELSTAGYLVFDGYMPGATTNKRQSNLGGGGEEAGSNDKSGACSFSDLRTWPISNDARFNPPLIADMLIWYDAGKGDDDLPDEEGDKFAGFFHYSANDGMENPLDGTKAGGGGNTVFLDGSVMWFEWDDLVSGIKVKVNLTTRGEQPAVDWGRRSVTSQGLGGFFCGLRPKAQ